MKTVEEHEVFADAVGKRIDMKRLESIAVANGNGQDAYEDCKEYLADALADLDGKLNCRFRITASLQRRWSENTILFSIRLYIRDGVLIGGHVLRKKCVGTDHSISYATVPTQQEIRVVERILQYLTEEKEDEE